MSQPQEPRFQWCFRWAQLIALGIVFAIVQRQVTTWLMTVDYIAELPSRLVSVIASFISMSTCFLIGCEMFSAFVEQAQSRKR